MQEKKKRGQGVTKLLMRASTALEDSSSCGVRRVRQKARREEEGERQTLSNFIHPPSSLSLLLH